MSISPERGEKLIGDIFDLFSEAKPSGEQTMQIIACVVHAIIELCFDEADHGRVLDAFIATLRDSELTDIRSRLQ